MDSTERRTIGPFKLLSLLLTYPTQEICRSVDRFRELAHAVDRRRTREGLLTFLQWLDVTPPNDVGQHYVHVFDLERRRTLYLTYYRYGDTRKRGMAIITFKETYRRAGFVPSEEELPDYLPMVLEFADLSPKGVSLLKAHRVELELLHDSLRAIDTPYAALLDATCGLLPELSRPERLQARRLRDAGPPIEEVGLEPFAPPEYLVSPSDAPRIPLGSKP